MTQRTVNFVSMIGSTAIGLPESDRIVYVGGQAFTSVTTIKNVLRELFRLTPQNVNDISWIVQVWDEKFPGRPIGVVIGQGDPNLDSLSAVSEIADNYVDHGTMQDLHNPLH